MAQGVWSFMQAYKGRVGWGNKEGVGREELWIGAVCSGAMWWDS